jgi:dolichol-phosphate mannosyltransferase
MTPRYSIVVPIYNEEDTTREMYRRVSQMMDQLDGAAELVLVDDGSRDGSLTILRELQQKDARVSYVSLARNFGHQIAVTAGLNVCRGQAIVVMDADLQDPPELVLAMAQKWRQGYQVVYAKRTQRTAESTTKRFLAYAFYRILRRLADFEIPSDVGDFCLMDRQVVDILNAMPERHRYIRGLRSWVGFRHASIDFERDARFAGKPKYTFVRSLRLAVDGLVSFSKAPLRLAIYLGLSSAALATLMIGLILYWRFVQPESRLVGSAALVAVMFFLGAVQLIGIGFLGEYVGRIYEEVKGRPLYTVREIGGCLPPEHMTAASVQRWAESAQTIR